MEGGIAILPLSLISINDFLTYLIIQQLRKWLQTKTNI